MWLVLIFSGIGILFWYQEWVYNLPTPVPVDYEPVAIGAGIEVPGIVSLGPSKPVFLHFFNPDCPCSRFNIPHFKSLVQKYGGAVNFVIVPMMLKGHHYTAVEIQNKFGLNVPVLFNSEIAAVCGVYATPQAVIIGQGDKLYYRGNYNRSRYCTDTKSNYAQIALEGLLQKTENPVFNPIALKAYGCQIPTCRK